MKGCHLADYRNMDGNHMNCFIQYDIATFKFEAKQIMKFVLSAFISMKCKDIKNLMFIF